MRSCRVIRNEGKCHQYDDIWSRSQLVNQRMKVVMILDIHSFFVVGTFTVLLREVGSLPR